MATAISIEPDEYTKGFLAGFIIFALITNFFFVQVWEPDIKADLFNKGFRQYQLTSIAYGTNENKQVIKSIKGYYLDNNDLYNHNQASNMDVPTNWYNTNIIYKEEATGLFGIILMELFNLLVCLLPSIICQKLFAQCFLNNRINKNRKEYIVKGKIA